MNDLISVIMSVYNEDPNWLQDSIESILNQTHKNLEFLIVLDDPNNLFLHNIIENYEKKDDRIRYYKNAKNLGLIASLNKLLKKVNGNYVCRMDADDISKTDRLEKQLEFIKRNNIDFIFSDVDIIDESGRIIEIKKEHVQYTTNQLARILKYGNISKHPTWFFKKNVYNQIGEYRDIPSAEDYDYILRCIHNGIQVQKMDSSILYYRYRDTSISRSNALNQIITSNILKNFYRKGEIENKGKIFREIENEMYRLSENEKKKYSDSREKFLLGTRLIKKKCFIKGTFAISNALLGSRHMRNDFFNVIKFQLIKKV